MNRRCRVENGTGQESPRAGTNWNGRVAGRRLQFAEWDQGPV